MRFGTFAFKPGVSSRLEAGNLVAVAKATVDELMDELFLQSSCSGLCALLYANHDHAGTAILRVIAAQMITAGTSGRSPSPPAIAPS